MTTAELLAENERLRVALAAALEQQTATSEILRVISRSPTDVQPAFDAIVASASRLCEAEFSAVARFEGGLLHLVAVSNMSPVETAAYHSLFPRPPLRNFVIGRAFVEGRPVHVEDVLIDPDYDSRTLEVLQGAATYRTYLGIPILRNGAPIGVIGCGRREVKPFTATQIDLVKTFADQALIAIENVRLFQELEARNAELTESLAHQMATGDILRSISASPTDQQPVFDAIARNSVVLCGGVFGAVFRFDGELMHVGALHGFSAEGEEATRRAFPTRPDRRMIAARAVLTRQIVHVPDVTDDPEFDHRALAATAGWRSLLVVPMLQGSEVLGTVGVARAVSGPFRDRQIDLLKTFADQAVIAIENVRLFNETKGALEHVDERDPPGHRKFADRRATRIRDDRPKRSPRLCSLGLRGLRR